MRAPFFLRCRSAERFRTTPPRFVAIAAVAVLAGSLQPAPRFAAPLGGTVSAQVAPASRPVSVHPDAGPLMAWPAIIPARAQPPDRDRLFITVLGEVRTPLADATYDPAADRLRWKNGTTIDHYYRDRLGIRYYAPLDKTRFALPPSGWCSWYYYYQEIDAGEVLANAAWVAANLEPFGARYVQIDDGWQGTGHGSGGNRDWSTIDTRFRDPGMPAIASRIRELGLEAGIWLAPHGQSNQEVVRSWGAFLHRPDGTSPSSTWEGEWLLDPSLPAARDYLGDLFRRLKGWGYTYYKIDGQPIVIGEYRARTGFMAAPPPAGDPEGPIQLYRGTLRTIRDAIGPDSYLLGCWGTPLDGAGIMNGSRTAGDIVQGWDGFLVAADAVQRWNFLHNIVWYSDPDVLLVRPPLSDGTARSWATIQGLSGQALMASDNMPDLPASRVELLRRIYPATDIRPLDLFRPDRVRKPIWDLKVAHLGRSYDVVGVFNFSELAGSNELLRWETLGLDPDGIYHVWDFWSGTYLGAWENGIFLDVPAGDVRVVTLVPHDASLPVLLSTSRHITQGWVDLRALSPGGVAEREAGGPVMRGRSRIIGGDPYTLTFGLPRSEPTWSIASVSVRVPQGTPAPRHEEASHQGYATVTIRSDVTAEVEWDVTFEPATIYRFGVHAPSAPRVVPEGLTRAMLLWSTEYYLKAGYRVELDGRPLGVAFAPTAVLRDLEPGRSYRIGVRSVWYDGTTGEGVGETVHVVELPDILYLSDLDPLSARQGWRSLRLDRSVEGNPLSVGGVRAGKGLGTHADAELRYPAFGRFRAFRARVGADDEISAPRAVEMIFEVWGDGRLLWSSGTLMSGQPPVEVNVDISGIREVTLRVRGGTDGIDNDHADWLDARFIR